MSTIPKRPGVVVGVDGSSSARSALRWAARDAAIREVPLTVVSALPPLVGSRMPAPVPMGVIDWERESAQRILDDAVRLAKSHTNGALDISAVMHSGAAVPALVDLSDGADLVVVGRSGTNAVLRAVLGSVSSGVLHYAHSPVAVVHGGIAPADGPVLVGIDGSPSSEYALEVACREASLRRVDLVALHSWWAPGAWEFDGADFEAAYVDLSTWLERRLAPWRLRYPAITMRHKVVRDQPARRLRDYPESAQLIVVGSHGYGGFTGMLLGSVSHALVQSASVPVIVARRR